MNKINALMIQPEKDNVIVATEEIHAGDQVSYKKGSQILEVTARQDIPIYHKIAAETILCGDQIKKYGEVMGVALQNISPGDYVHVHNAGSVLKTGN